MAISCSSGEFRLSMWFKKTQPISSLWNELIYSHLSCLNKSLQADRHRVSPLWAPTLYQLTLWLCKELAELPHTSTPINPRLWISFFPHPLKSGNSALPHVFLVLVSTQWRVIQRSAWGKKPAIANENGRSRVFVLTRIHEAQPQPRPRDALWMWSRGDVWHRW